MTDHEEAGAGAPVILKDEQLAAVVSAYLDRQLEGPALEQFEDLLRENKALARELTEMRRIEEELSNIGETILSEPIPDALLQALSRSSQ